MALTDLTRADIKTQVDLITSDLEAVKNRLTDRINWANAIPVAVINKYFDAAEKTELTDFKTKITAIRDEIIAQGF